MATAEFAVALPAVVIVLVIAMSGIMTVVAQARCADAARVAVRELARGESTSQVLAVARTVAPDGAHITTAASGEWVRVDVSVGTPPLLRRLGLPRTVSATSVTVAESPGPG